MQVTDEMFNKLSRLAMLRFNEHEKEDIKKDLEQMIGFFDKLKELDTSGIEPLLHMTPNINILREDSPGNMLTREEALQNASNQDGIYFKVPKVINKPE
ncbi:MAG TPA: Asp-tRNA(Asn)/Glu-tRNA(Gln) amidotransferase subunit GatC [Flavisolibacter sp.]|jgi:aspartyl-tRNA(Asn)/glutamyl-tRNA(Gln) amidotransferase subunit C|nr:Asp-tRNA(Asn)/Glu-tRNA(Gln) amidotransferase subunit GatC [Flavisolibacter sp.]